MTDGYEQEEKDYTDIENTSNLSSLSAEEIYTILGCEELDEE